MNKEARSIQSSYFIGQLRQLRSQFHHPTTYMLCRAFSSITMSRFCQSLTVFTYVDFEGIKKSTDNSNASTIASRLFQNIGYNLIKSPSDATLNKDIVLRCIDEKIQTSVGKRQE